MINRILDGLVESLVMLIFLLIAILVTWYAGS